MARVLFRLYAELNDRLPAERRQRPFEAEVPDGQPLGEALRALGVDPEQVDLALIDGTPAPLDRPLTREARRVAAYPVFEAFDVAPLVAGAPLRQTRFAVEPGLWRLLFALRAAGFDAVPVPAPRPGSASGEPPAPPAGRILLTAGPAPAGATHALSLERGPWWHLLGLVLARLHLEPSAGESWRCARCNAVLPLGASRDPAAGAAATCGACGRASRGGLRRRAMARAGTLDARRRD